MTVAKLKEMLAEAPDDMKVMLLGESVLGGFLFIPACEGESGIIELGPPEDDEFSEGHGPVFALMPHGATIAEDEENDEFDTTPLN